MASADVRHGYHTAPAYASTDALSSAGVFLCLNGVAIKYIYFLNVAYLLAFSIVVLYNYFTPTNQRKHKMAKTTTMICENTDGYFVAFLDNGGVRVGLRGCTCYDFPAEHKDFKRCAELTIDTVEDAHDEFTGRYCFN